MTVPAPHDRRAALGLMEVLEHQPFRPDAAPWDVTLIDGLAGGRGAMYLRADHALTDGLGGMALIDLLFDGDERQHRAPPVEAMAGIDRPDDGVDAETEITSRRPPGPLTLSVDLTRAARPVAAGIAAGIEVMRSAPPLDAVVRSLQQGVDLLSSVSRQLVVTGGPLSPLRDRHPTTSHFEIVSIPLARRTSLALGGSRNDLLVAGVAAALGAYHQQRGTPCGELRLAVPTSRRHDRGAAGNWFSLTRVEVPTDGSHPAPQFGVISERLAQARTEPAIRYTEALAAAVGLLPARMLIPALQAQVDSIDFVATALPGFRRPPRICGASVEGSYPFGPRVGCLVNVAAFGNQDRLDIGLALDPVAIDEPQLFIDCLTTALGRLVAAASDPAHQPTGPGAGTDA